MVGKCKLCFGEKELCKQSHIIPNFMYKGIFDDKNRLLLVGSEKGILTERGYRQTGEFDNQILRHSCDNVTLGKLDRYASLILYDGYPKIFENRKDNNGMEYTFCGEIDYTKFKLFLLSIVWRASVSKRPLFKEVQLGPHEDRIRQMIINGDPGEQFSYPCLIMTYLHLKDFPSDLVGQPSRTRFGGGYIYKFLIGGMIYIFFISNHIILLIPPEIRNCVINLEGELKIIHSSPALSRRILGSMIGIRLD